MTVPFFQSLASTAMTSTLVISLPCSSGIHQQQHEKQAKQQRTNELLSSTIADCTASEDPDDDDDKRWRREHLSELTAFVQKNGGGELGKLKLDFYIELVKADDRGGLETAEARRLAVAKYITMVKEFDARTPAASGQEYDIRSP